MKLLHSATRHPRIEFQTRTVEELIAALQTFDKTMSVYVKDEFGERSSIRMIVPKEDHSVFIYG